MSNNGYLTTEVDGSISNEIQDISTTGASGNLSLSNGSTLALNVDDADASSINELQTISKTGNNVTLSNGGGTFIDAGDDADASATNEIQDISTTGVAGNLSLSSGSTLVLNVDDADANNSNELQTISKTGTSVTLSNGGGTFIDVGSFSTSSNITSNSPGAIATDDFVFGSTSLDNSIGTSGWNRMFFDKSKGAFRIGILSGSESNDVNRGDYSIAMGRYTTASGLEFL